MLGLVVRSNVCAVRRWQPPGSDIMGRLPSPSNLRGGNVDALTLSSPITG
jgi:hypothetical protein